MMEQQQDRPRVVGILQAASIPPNVVRAFYKALEGQPLEDHVEELVSGRLLPLKQPSEIPGHDMLGRYPFAVDSHKRQYFLDISEDTPDGIQSLLQSLTQQHTLNVFVRLPRGETRRAQLPNATYDEHPAFPDSRERVQLHLVHSRRYVPASYREPYRQLIDAIYRSTVDDSNSGKPMTTLRQPELLECQVSSITWDKHATAQATLELLEPNASLPRLLVQGYVEAMAFVNLLITVIRREQAPLLSAWNDSLRAHKI